MQVTNWPVIVEPGKKFLALPELRGSIPVPIWPQHIWLVSVHNVVQLWQHDFLKNNTHTGLKKLAAFESECIFIIEPYIHIFLCPWRVVYVLKVNWVEPFIQGEVQAKCQVCTTSDGMCKFTWKYNGPQSSVAELLGVYVYSQISSPCNHSHKWQALFTTTANPVCVSESEGWGSIPTRSLWGPLSTEFQFQETLDFQFVQPSWCLLVKTKYLSILYAKQGWIKNIEA